MVVQRFGVYLCPLDPTVGAEMQKTRPCVVLSPDEMNRRVRTVVLAPMTTKISKLPFRVNCRFLGKNAQIALDQMRALDRQRFIRPLGKLDSRTADSLMRTVAAMFHHQPHQK